eukprot:c20796_g1_i2 orf=148-564(-)
MFLTGFCGGQLWKRLQGVDKRLLQLEIDTHRLCLLTSCNKVGADSIEKHAQTVLELESQASFDEQRRQVQDNVHDQVCRIAAAMDEILVVNLQKKRSDNIKTTEEKRSRPSGLSFAVGGTSSRQDQKNMLVDTQISVL